VAGKSPQNSETEDKAKIFNARTMMQKGIVARARRVSGRSSLRPSFFLRVFALNLLF
jgi:hypothetical protein